MLSSRPKTPCLLLSSEAVRRNIQTMVEATKRLDVSLRVHMKTTKCDDIAKLQQKEFGIERIAVSTLREAREFQKAGCKDILYAVPITPNNFADAFAIADTGVELSTFVTSLQVAEELISESAPLTNPIGAFIEIDADRYRGGISPDTHEFLALANALQNARNVNFKGIYNFAGRTYTAQSPNEGSAIVRENRNVLVEAAAKLRDKGVEFPDVIIGGSPVATFADNLDGISEICAGVFVFQDLFQTGLGVSDFDDVAVSVLTTVIDANTRTGKVFVDAGALALAQDRSTQSQTLDTGFGLVADPVSGEVIKGCRVVSVSQEHGHIHCSTGLSAVERFPIGSTLRVLPNHVCMTASAHPHYHVVDREGRVSEIWERFSGW